LLKVLKDADAYKLQKSESSFKQGLPSILPYIFWVQDVGVGLAQVKFNTSTPPLERIYDGEKEFNATAILI